MPQHGLTEYGKRNHKMQYTLAERTRLVARVRLKDGVTSRDLRDMTTTVLKRDGKRNTLFYPEDCQVAAAWDPAMRVWDVRERVTDDETS